MAPLTETGIEVVFTPESIDDDIRREGVLCMIEVRSRVNRRNATLGARGGPGVDAAKAGVQAPTAYLAWAVVLPHKQFFIARKAHTSQKDGFDGTAVGEGTTIASIDGLRRALQP